MMNPLIIKLGGVLLDSEEALERLFSALVNYRESHQRPLVIVHGGGCVVDELMKGLNLPVKKKNGLRVTPADQIDIITGALAGTANKTLLAWAKKHQIAAVGLFLGDGDSVKVTYVIEISDYDGTARFTAVLVSDASDFSADCFTVSWLIAGEDRDTVSVVDNGENIVVTVTMNDSSAGEGRFYSSPPSFSSLTLVASLA